jgi:hypothetical protein
LAHAIEGTQAIAEFMEWYARSHITSDEASSLLKSSEDLRRALLTPRTDILTHLTTSAEAEVSRLGLTVPYADFKAGRKPRIPLNELATTEKNTFLVDGPDDEIVFLINNTGHGNAIRDLHGEIAFDQGKATVCFAHPHDLDRFSLLQIRLELQTKGARAISLSEEPCSTRSLTDYDVIVAARGQLLRTPKGNVQALLEIIDSDDFSKFAMLSEREIQKRRDEESVESLNLQNEIVKGSKSGYGIIAVDNHSAVICQTAEDDHPITHKHLLDRKLEQLEYEFQSPPRVVQTSIDSAYIALQRGDCRAIYGSAGGLKKVLESVQRGKLKYHVSPIWFSTDDFERQKDRIAKSYANCLQRSSDVIRKQEDEEALRRKHLDQDDESRKRLQDELRKQYGAAAVSFENAIQSETKRYVESPKERHSAVRQKYPQFTTWYENKLRDGWELLNISSEMDD